ncbi:MAG: hypothetical protein A2W91_04610 [Bacteroidetes bacterium GWF2_38_335]|nr:MAG: hypothetical protein A2W91_04610 [Bacteroidetes bacterium GWF2_38_335]HBS88211.1 hypothetical protein [Bacteroidales bacterium]
MNKILNTLLLIMLGTILLSAQTSKKATLKREKGKDFSRNSIYIGILGPTIPGSLNYEHIWSKNGVVNIGTKFGGFYSRFPDTYDLTIANGSFECTFIFGRSKHLFEMGIGYAGHYGSYYNDKEQKTKHYGIPTSTFTMHYRFQKPSGGFFFHAGFSGNTILLFASSDLKELVIGNAAIQGFDLLTGEKPSFSMLSIGIGFAFPK